MGAICVVAQHVAHSGIILDGELAGSSGWWLYVWTNGLTRWVVPVFVMLSGALLLDPLRREPLGAFYKKRLSRIAIPTIAWSVLYIAVNLVYHKSTWDVQALNLIRGVPYYHMHFMFIIAGLYAVTPLIRQLTAGQSKPRLLVVALLLLALASTAEFFGAFNGYRSNAFTRWIPYVGYFVAGYGLRSCAASIRVVTISIGCLLFGTIAISWSTGLAWLDEGWGGPSSWMNGFLSPGVILQSLGVFMLFSWLYPNRQSKLGRTVGYLAAGSLGVYLLHPLVLVGFLRLLPSSIDGSPWLKVPVLLLGVSLVSWLAIMIARRNRLARFVTG